MKNLLLLTMLLMISARCPSPNSYPTIQKLEQLSAVFVYEEINGKEYISVEKSKCLSRTYEHEKHHIGPVDKAIKLNIKECNKVIGYAPSSYGTLATWKENFRLWLLDI